MTQKFFSVTDPSRAHYLGGLPAKNADELCTGLLAIRNADGTVQVATAADKPAGFIETRRLLTWAPTTEYAAAGENVTLVSGDVIAVCDKNYFVGGVLPAMDAVLYSAAGGLMDVAGTNIIGKIIGAFDQRAVPNSTQNIVMVHCAFGGKD